MTLRPMLIPRKTLFGNPERAAARLSPDGKQLAYLAPHNGALNVWVAPTDRPLEAQCVTQDRERGIRVYTWAHTNRHILYMQDSSGNEDFHIYCVDLETAEIIDLTPLEKVSARIVGVSERHPEHVLIGLNDREEGQLHDVYRVHITTAERELIQQNPGFLGFLCDDEYDVRLALTFTPEAEQLYLAPDQEGGWAERWRMGAEDAMTTAPQGFDKSGKRMYLLDSRGRDKAALKLVALDSGKEELIIESDRADISDVFVHPTEKHVRAVCLTHARTEWKVVDASVQRDFDFLLQAEPGELALASQSMDDRRWIVAYLVDNGPARYFLYERNPESLDAEPKLSFLFANRSDLEGLALSRMHELVIQARDGLDLVCYLSLPPDADRGGRPSAPLPLVLLVHGGPWARDIWGYSAEHQLLTNRGYAVLSVNFRGSTGFGKSFINAGDRQWSEKMHEDLVDAVEWAIREKVANKHKVAIMGGSYGGYATLVGLTFTPELFACGVDIVGPSNLITLLENPPPYWAPFMPVLKHRVGDWTAPDGRKDLERRSPLSYVDRIQRPLLIGQGKHDPRVKQAESDQIVQAMEEKGIPVTYLLYEDEGHGFARPENRFAFYAVAEAFLASHLGGQFEPIGDAFDKSSIQVLSGRTQVPGLAEGIQK